MSVPISAQLQSNRIIFLVMKVGPIAPGPTAGIRYGRLLRGNRPYVCPARPSCSPIGTSLVSKGCFRWGDPTRLPTPRQRTTLVLHPLSLYSIEIIIHVYNY